MSKHQRKESYRREGNGENKRWRGNYGVKIEKKNGMKGKNKEIGVTEKVKTRDKETNIFGKRNLRKGNTKSWKQRRERAMKKKSEGDGLQTDRQTERKTKWVKKIQETIGDTKISER